MNNLDQRIRIIFETLGAEKTDKAIKKIIATSQTKYKALDKIGRRYGLDRKGSQELIDQSEQAKNLEQQNTLLEQKNNLQKNYARQGIVINDIQKKSVDQIKNEAALFKTKQKNARRFKAEYLSIMFAGMQLQRTFGGLFKQLISNYKEFTKESVTPLSESLIRLEANWKFLKFALLDAAEPLIKPIADFFANLAISVSKMNPETLSSLVGVIGGLALLGGLAFTFGQGALLFSSLANAASFKSGLLGVENAIRETNGMETKKLQAGTTFFESLREVAGIGLTVIGIGSTIKNVLEDDLTSLEELGFSTVSTGLGIGLLTKDIKTGIIAAGTIVLITSLANAGKILANGKAVEFGTVLEESIKTGIGAGLLTGVALSKFTAMGAGAAGGIGAGVGVIAAGTVLITLETDRQMKGLGETQNELLKYAARKKGLNFEDKAALINWMNENIEIITAMKKSELGMLGIFKTPEAIQQDLKNNLRILIESYDEGVSTEQEFQDGIENILGFSLLTKQQQEAIKEKMDSSNTLAGEIKSKYGDILQDNKDLNTELEKNRGILGGDFSIKGLWSTILGTATGVKSVYSEQNTELDSQITKLERIKRLQEQTSNNKKSSNDSEEEDEINYSKYAVSTVNYWTPS